jgi:hypothetical protein
LINFIKKIFIYIFFILFCRKYFDSNNSILPINKHFTMTLDEKSFKQAYKKAKSPQEKSNLILQNADLLKPEMVPITKKLKNNYEVTYYVGKKDVSVGDFPIAMDPHTAEALAHKWNYWLPTNKVVDDIHKEAYKGNNLIQPSLLSASGYYDPDIDGYLSAEDVVKDVSRHSAIIEFGDRIENELKKKNIGNKVSVTNGKMIIAPVHPIDPNATNLPVFFKGIPISYKENENGDIEVVFGQAGKDKSPHVTSEINRYLEYCDYFRGVAHDVFVKAPDGSKYTTTYPAAQKDPNIASAFTDTPGQELQTYIPRDTSGKAKSDTAKPTSQQDMISSIQEKAKEFGQKAQEFGQAAKEKATEWAGSAKEKLQKLFASAHSFELLAISSLDDIEIKKIAKYNAPRKGMKTRWSAKYKKKIDCNNPKGFSQKAYCARKRRGGKYKS